MQRILATLSSIGIVISLFLTTTTVRTQSLSAIGNLDGTIMGVAMSPSGKRSLTVHSGGHISIFDNATKRRILKHRLSNPNEFAVEVKFIDDKRIFFGSSLGGLYVLEIETSTLRELPINNDEYILTTAIGENIILAGTMGGRVILYDIAKTQLIKTIELGKDAMIGTSAVHSFDMVAAFGSDEGVEIISLQTLSRKKIQRTTGYSSSSMQFSIDGSTLIFVLDSVHTYDIAADKIATLGHVHFPVTHPPIMAKDPSTILCYSTFAVIARELPSLDVKWVQQLPLSPTSWSADSTGSLMITAYGSDDARLSHRSTPLHDFFGHTNTVFSVGYLKDSILYSADRSGGLKLWNTNSGVTQLFSHVPGLSAASSAGPDRLLFGTNLGAVNFINVDAWAASLLEGSHASLVTTIDYEPVSGRIASGSLDSTVIVRTFTGNATNFGPFESAVLAVKFLNANILLIGTERRIRYLVLSSGEFPVDKSAFGKVNGISFSQKASRVYFATSGGISNYDFEGKFMGSMSGTAPFLVSDRWDAFLYRNSGTSIMQQSLEEGGLSRVYSHNLTYGISLALSPDQSSFAVGGSYGGLESYILTGLSSVPMVSDERNRPNSLVDVSVIANPFSTTTEIEYILGRTAQVEISVYNALGQVVWSKPFGAVQDARMHRLTVGQDLPPGSYFLRLATMTGDVQTVKLIKE